tara:strand:+ start:1051 stop:1920 length:870 start_codon:yes stop_codon:yes gene_type:complete
MGLLSGILSSKTVRDIAKGGAIGILNTIEEERKNGENYMTELKAAREDVTTEGQLIGDNYNKALRVMEGTGNTAFNNFLYEQMTIAQLAGLADLAPTTKDQQLKQLKFQFEALGEAEQNAYKEGNYAEQAKEQYDKEIEDLRVSKGLVNNNRMGENTVASLITKGVRQKFKKEEDKVIGQAIVPEIVTPAVEEGAGIYESIGETAFSESRLKLMIDQDYIDGTLEDLVRNRLINEGTFNIDSQELQTLVNQEYNKQVNSAKQIFMSQGDDLIATITAEVTDENIDELLT